MQSRDAKQRSQLEYKMARKDAYHATCVAYAEALLDNAPAETIEQLAAKCAEQRAVYLDACRSYTAAVMR
jgi:hypothetical protein